ncbi:hypothetical protein J6S88_07590 [bacterium]|nr:hypothetical protein [bacterium]
MFNFFGNSVKQEACSELNIIYRSLKGIYDFSTISAGRKEYLTDLITRYGYLPYPFRKAQEELTPNEVLFGLEIKWVQNKVFDGEKFIFSADKQSVLARKNIKNSDWIKKEGHDIKLITLSALADGNRTDKTGKFMDWLTQLLILPTGNLENGIFNTTIYLTPFHPREFGCAYLPKSNDVSENLLDEGIKEVTGMGVKKQVQTFIQLAQLAGHPVIYDILPQTGRFSKTVLANPEIARWFDIKELNKKLTKNIDSLIKKALPDCDDDDFEVIKNIYLQSQNESSGTLSEKYQKLFEEFSKETDKFKKEISECMLKLSEQKKLQKRVKAIIEEIEGGKVNSESDIKHSGDVIRKLIEEDLWTAPGGAWCSVGVPIYDTMSECGGYPMFKHYDKDGKDVTSFANLDCQTPYYFVNLENGTYNNNVADYFISEMEKLRKDYNFDGFRIDHIDHIVDENSEKNGVPISYRAPKTVLNKLNKALKSKTPYFAVIAEYMLWNNYYKEYSEDMNFDVLWGNDIVLQYEKTPQKIVDDNQNLTNFNVTKKNKNYLSILKTYNNQDGEFHAIDQYPAQLGAEGALFKWFKYKFLPGGKFAQRPMLYADGDESFTKGGLEHIINEEVPLVRAQDYPFFDKFDAIDRFVKENPLITDGEAQIIREDDDGFVAWIITKEPLKDGFLIVANYKSATERTVDANGEPAQVQNLPVYDKIIMLPADYTIVFEYKFDGISFVKEEFSESSELKFDEIDNSEFRIFGTKKL